MAARQVGLPARAREVFFEGERHGQVVVRDGVARVEADRRRQVLERFVAPPDRRERASEVALGLGEIGGGLASAAR